MPVGLIPLLLRYAPQLIAGLVVVIVLGFIGSAIHNNGRQVERAIWQAKALDEASVHEAQLKAAWALAEALEEQHQEKIQEIKHVKEQAIEKLNRDIADISARGLYIPTPRPDPRTQETKDTSGVSGSADRVRLPPEIETGLLDLARDAQRVVVQYESCRSALMSLTEVVPDPP